MGDLEKLSKHLKTMKTRLEAEYEEYEELRENAEKWKQFEAMLTEYECESLRDLIMLAAEELNRNLREEKITEQMKELYRMQEGCDERTRRRLGRRLVKRCFPKKKLNEFEGEKEDNL